MPKMKTKSAAAKRFKVSASGKVKFKRAGKRHQLGHRKSAKRKTKARNKPQDKSPQKLVHYDPNEQRSSDARASADRGHGGAWRQINLVELNRRLGGHMGSVSFGRRTRQCVFTPGAMRCPSAGPFAGLAARQAGRCVREAGTVNGGGTQLCRSA